MLPTATPGLKVHICSLVAPDSQAHDRKPVYIHSKLMLIDDVFTTLGSANTVIYSGETCRQGGFYRTYWNGRPCKELLYPDRPAPTFNVMEPVPYRWLPAFINNRLRKQRWLPMALVKHAVRWELTNYLR